MKNSKLIELEKRIKELEDRVKWLEARPIYVPYNPAPSYPQWQPPTWAPWITYCDNHS